MLIYCNIIPCKGCTSNQVIIEEDEGIILIPMNQSSITVIVRLNIEDTFDNNDIEDNNNPRDIFNQKSVLLRLVSRSTRTEWTEVNEKGSEFCLPVTSDAFQIWALEAKGYNACYPANFALFPSGL